MSLPRGHILITGASTGIGRTCAAHLASQGFSVFAAVRKPADVESLRAEAGASGLTSRLQPIILDVTDPTTISAAAATLEPIVGNDGLAGLVNNAGIGVVGPIEFIPIDDWRKQFEVNVFGQIAVTQAMLPLLRKRVLRTGHGSARIVMMSSIAGLVGQPILSPYSASKHALEAIADALRLELAKHGIRTCLVEPGAIKSEIWRKGEQSASAIERSSEAYRLYGRIIDAVANRASEAGRRAIPALTVARVVERCLSSSKAPERVLVGGDARKAAWAKWLLPTSLFDVVLARALGVPLD
jgi:NAD(P)-dependent dehydrogenase (short-subunit alcohol dehydrogenase family)